MNEQTPADRAPNVWQSIGKEHTTMSIEEVRIHAYLVNSKVRRNIIVTCVLAGLVLVLGGITITRIGMTPVRLTTAALMALAVVAVYGVCVRMWPRQLLSPDAAAQGCVTFYRSALEAQHRSLQVTWRFLALIVVFAFLVRNAVLQWIPGNARVASVAILAVILLERRYQAHKVRRSLKALGAFEQEQS